MVGLVLTPYILAILYTVIFNKKLQFNENVKVLFKMCPNYKILSRDVEFLWFIVSKAFQI